MFLELYTQFCLLRMKLKCCENTGFNYYSSQATFVKSVEQCITKFYQHALTVFTASCTAENQTLNMTLSKAGACAATSMRT